jgi:hypothetical protein
MAVAASCLLIVGGCSVGDGDDSDDDDGGGAVSKRIGPEGGTLETRGMRLEVPPGALASEVELTVSTSSETPRGYDAVSIGRSGETSSRRCSTRCGAPGVTARHDDE